MKERLFNSLNFLTIGTASSVPEGRVFALDEQTAIGVAIMIFNIAILCFILYKLLYKPAKNILKDRTQRIQDRLDELTKREEEADALILEYKEKIAGADRESQQIINKARHEAEDERRRIIAAAEHEAEKIKEDAVAAMDRERQLLHYEVKDHVIELSVLLAEKALKDSASPEKQDEQFEEGLRKLGITPWQE